VDDEVSPADDGAQAAVAARLPGAAALGLVAPPMGTVVPATRLADPGWTAQVLTERAARQRSADRRVLATLWWYSVSSVLLTPALAGLVTGRPLSARLAATRVHLLAGAAPIAATTSAGRSADLVDDLRGTLTAVVGAVAEAGGTRPRPLWAIATDSLANRLLALGRAVGDVEAVTALAGPLAAAIGEPMPAPRYVDVASPTGGTARFTRRASCCLLYRVPHEVVCTSCPRRDPAERQVLLEDAATRM
jgi:ferric iron reductase protein FhuF